MDENQTQKKTYKQKKSFAFAATAYIISLGIFGGILWTFSVGCYHSYLDDVKAEETAKRKAENWDSLTGILSRSEQKDWKLSKSPHIDCVSSETYMTSQTAYTQKIYFDSLMLETTVEVSK